MTICLWDRHLKWKNVRKNFILRFAWLVNLYLRPVVCTRFFGKKRTRPPWDLSRGTWKIYIYILFFKISLKATKKIRNVKPKNAYKLRTLGMPAFRTLVGHFMIWNVNATVYRNFSWRNHEKNFKKMFTYWSSEGMRKNL